MDTKGIDQMIGQLRATADAAAGKASSAQEIGGTDFSQVLQSAMQDVSKAQSSAQDMAKDFSAGNPEVNLQHVMVNLQKASLSFQQMVQVRNKLVQAYQEILAMPI